MTTRLYLIRHGQTAHSAADCFSGASDVDLADEGRRCGPSARGESDKGVWLSYGAIHENSPRRGDHALPLAPGAGLNGPVGVLFRQPCLHQPPLGPVNQLAGRQVGLQLGQSCLLYTSRCV